MKDEIEVGEYVRLARNQGINKIIDIEDNLYEIDDIIANEYGDETYYIKKEDIVKHSKNIIDLIEAGDILEINKEKYEVIYDNSYEKLGVLIPNRKQLAVRHCSLEYIFSKKGIAEFKKIKVVIKEQIAQIEYKVGE